MGILRSKMVAGVLIASLALFVVIFGLAYPSTALAWDDCPKGLVNDPFPGACSRYRDTNGDNICDLSQPEPIESTTTTAVVGQSTATTQKSTATTTTLAVTTTTSGEPPTGDCPLGPCAGCGACASIGVVVTGSAENLALEGDSSVDLTEATSAEAVLAAVNESATTSTTVSSSGGSSGGSSLLTRYKVSPIAIGLFFVYAVSFVLYKTKRIRITTHRKIWNVLLLATFLITGIFGLILTIQLDYKLPFAIPFDLLFWHVEAGIAMTLISFFHIGWHFNYYRNILRTSRSKTAAARASERARVSRSRQPALEARERRRANRHTRPEPETD